MPKPALLLTLFILCTLISSAHKVAAEAMDDDVRVYMIEVYYNDCQGHTDVGYTFWYCDGSYVHHGEYSAAKIITYYYCGNHGTSYCYQYVQGQWWQLNENCECIA